MLDRDTKVRLTVVSKPLNPSADLDATFRFQVRPSGRAELSAIQKKVSAEVGCAYGDTLTALVGFVAMS
jgi:hypothetical protein